MIERAPATSTRASAAGAAECSPWENPLHFFGDENGRRIVGAMRPVARLPREDTRRT